ncbi:MAG: (d)CMP kinase [Oscillospiraceae bacterium]|nr:(d)CMP kinase [Oscillospiraceae bacterium]
MYNIAIDGPAGAGKSTLARKLAERLGFVYVDTGAMYRAIAYYALLNQLMPMEEIISHLPCIHIALRYEHGVQRVYINDMDVSDKIRTDAVSMTASRVSALPEVRAFLLDLQQQLAKRQSVVMDGRDIGTVVLPNAHVKIFLTASPEERAKRRHIELCEKMGKSAPDYSTVLADVIQRDHQDSTRAIAPLKQAEDAVLLDTTSYDLEESLEALYRICKERLEANE